MVEIALSAMLPKIQDPELEYAKYLNFLVSLRERRQNARAVSARPFDITVDVSTACQLHCPYCSTGNGTIDRESMQMDLAMHEDILAKLGDTLFVVWYYSTGEPLLNKRFPELIAQTRGKEIFSIISTNLSMPLSDARIDAILQSGLGLLTVSLDGTCQESYSRYRRGGKFQLVVDNLNRLVRRKRELATPCPLLEWRFLIFRHNEHEIARARQMAEEIGVDALEFIYGSAPRDAPPDAVQCATLPLQGGTESGTALDAGLRRRDTHLRRLLGGEVRHPPPHYEPHTLHKKCDWLYFGSMIYPDGQVGPCCVMGDRKDDFGALRPTETFDEMWNNDKYRSGRGLPVGDADPDIACRRCTQKLSMDVQFAKTVNGILANAPDWVLAAIAAAPDAFLHEIDYGVWPCVNALTQIQPGELTPSREVLAKLRKDSAGSTAWHEHVRDILGLLTRGEKRPWWSSVLSGGRLRS